MLLSPAAKKSANEGMMGSREKKERIRGLNEDLKVQEKKHAFRKIRNHYASQSQFLSEVA